MAAKNGRRLGRPAEAKNLCRNLRRLMSRRGLSTRALARASGLSQAIVAKLSAGDPISPTLATIAGLARGLGVSVTELISSPR